MAVTSLYIGYLGYPIASLHLDNVSRGRGYGDQRRSSGESRHRGDGASSITRRRRV